MSLQLVPSPPARQLADLAVHLRSTPIFEPRAQRHSRAL
jgi:hypothetical protein